MPGVPPVTESGWALERVLPVNDVGATVPNYGATEGGTLVTSVASFQWIRMLSMTDDGGVTTDSERTLRKSRNPLGQVRSTLPGRRRPKQSRDELRALLVSTGRTILQEEGFGTGAETLTFKRVFARVEADTGIRLTNASIIGRVWANQADFQTDVIAAVAADEGADERMGTVEALVPVLDDLDVSSPQGRLDALRELCRVGGAANIESLRRSENWSIWIGVWALATVGAHPDQRAKIESALMEGYSAVTEQYEELYLSLLGILGLRLREGLTIRQFTIAAGAMAEGCALRDRVDGSHMSGIIRPSGPGGEEQPWSLFGIALEALSRQFLELDPEWEPAEAADDATARA